MTHEERLEAAVQDVITASRAPLLGVLRMIVAVDPLPQPGSSRLEVTDWADALGRAQRLADEALDEFGPT